jgi:ribosome assembly protein 1
LKRRLDGSLTENNDQSEAPIRNLDHHIEAGFQLATFQGPLCSEPMEGMVFFVEKVEVDAESVEKEIGMSSLDATSRTMW